MPEVTLDLGTPTGFSAGNWVQWDERDNGLGDLSLFSDPAGEPRALIRLRIFRVDGTIQFQVIDVPDGSAGFASSEELLPSWEQYVQAIVVRSTGIGFDLNITGPNNSLSFSSDTTEPYGWDNGNDSTQQTWFDAFETAGRPATTVIISDGTPNPAVTDIDAGLSARAGNPTATIGAQREEVTNRDAGLSARAGNPTASLGAERVAVTDRDAGLSARAGNPTASIGAELVPPATAAAITDTAITSMPAALADTYGFGEVIEFSVTWDGPVDVTGTPTFPMNLGNSPPGGPEYADYAGGSGTAVLRFEWTVAATDLDTNGIFLYGPTDSSNSGDLVGGTIRNAGTAIDADRSTLSRGTQGAHKVDGSLGAPANRDAGMTARAGNPTASIGADAEVVSYDEGDDVYRPQFYVSRRFPTNRTLTEFEALGDSDWMHCGELTNLGSFGRSYDIVRYNEISEQAVSKEKSSWDNGNVDFELNYDSRDAGQVILEEALRSNDPYAVQIRMPRGDDGLDAPRYYFTALVTQLRPRVGGPNDVVIMRGTMEIEHYDPVVG